MLKRRRLVAAFSAALIVLAASAPAVAACAGWSISSGDRHACCAHLGELASEAGVTTCCAGGEQSNAPRDRDYQITLPMGPVSVTGALSGVSSESAAPVLDRVPVGSASPPKYILLASFLI
ncbi:MAG: hypothetical protein HYU37_01045 [Acidobacteria bacterium]|nr:hypothetical protein [Acidobacteriota bacterium]